MVVERFNNSELVQAVMSTWTSGRFEASVPTGRAWPPLAANVNFIDLVWLFFFSF